MVWLEVEARVVVRMELQGHQDVEVSGRKATSELKTGWGFHGNQDAQLVWVYAKIHEGVWLEEDVRAVNRMELQG